MNEVRKEGIAKILKQLNDIHWQLNILCLNERGDIEHSQADSQPTDKVDAANSSVDALNSAYNAVEEAINYLEGFAAA